MGRPAISLSIANRPTIQRQLDEEKTRAARDGHQVTPTLLLDPIPATLSYLLALVEHAKDLTGGTTDYFLAFTNLWNCYA